jgi:hypothetical protein
MDGIEDGRAGDGRVLGVHISEVWVSSHIQMDSAQHVLMKKIGCGGNAGVSWWFGIRASAITCFPTIPVMYTCPDSLVTQR